MSMPTRSIPSHIRQPSMSAAAHGASSSVSQSAALQARVNEKKAELKSLRELRDLSGAVATQMEALESKLATLSDGTEAIALLMGNWHNVLRAINMASTKLADPKGASSKATEEQGKLPQVLVRIPTEHAPTLQAHAEAAEEDGD